MLLISCIEVLLKMGLTSNANKSLPWDFAKFKHISIESSTLLQFHDY